MATDGCSGGKCALCQKIQTHADRSWCFEWLQLLKSSKDLEELDKKDPQVHLITDHIDNQITAIRLKLGRLQTQTVRFYSFILF